MKKDTSLSLDERLANLQELALSCTDDSEAFPEAVVAYVENGGALASIQELSRKTNWRFYEPERKFVVFINRSKLRADYQQTLDEIADRAGRSKTEAECLLRMRLLLRLAELWRSCLTFRLPTDSTPDLYDDLSSVSAIKSSHDNAARSELQSSAASAVAGSNSRLHGEDYSSKKLK